MTEEVYIKYIYILYLNLLWDTLYSWSCTSLPIDYHTCRTRKGIQHYTRFDASIRTVAADQPKVCAKKLAGKPRHLCQLGEGLFETKKGPAISCNEPTVPEPPISELHTVLPNRIKNFELSSQHMVFKGLSFHRMRRLETLAFFPARLVRRCDLRKTWAASSLLHLCL